MTKSVILMTAVCRLTSEGYEVQSPLYERVIGLGSTEKEAWKIYKELLDDMWIAHLEGNLTKKATPGRPAKDGVNIHAQITPESKAIIDRISTALGISRGDFLSFSVAAGEALISARQLEESTKVRQLTTIKSAKLSKTDSNTSAPRKKTK